MSTTVRNSGFHQPPPDAFSCTDKNRKSPFAAVRTKIALAVVSALACITAQAYELPKDPDLTDPGRLFTDKLDKIEPDYPGDTWAIHDDTVLYNTWIAAPKQDMNVEIDDGKQLTLYTYLKGEAGYEGGGKNQLNMVSAIGRTLTIKGGSLWLGRSVEAFDEHEADYIESYIMGVEDGHLILENTDLNVQYSRNGLRARTFGRADITANNVNITTGQGDTAHHTLVTGYNAEIHIDANNVFLANKGTTQRRDDEVNDSSNIQVDGGTVDIKANQLTITNDIENLPNRSGDKSSNYGVYVVSSGNYDGTVSLTGKGTGSRLVIDVKNTSEPAKSYGILSRPFYVGRTSTVNVTNFDVVNIQSGGNALWAYSTKKDDQTTRINLNNNGNVYISTTDDRALMSDARKGANSTISMTGNDSVTISSGKYAAVHAYSATGGNAAIELAKSRYVDILGKSYALHNRLASGNGTARINMSESDTILLSAANEDGIGIYNQIQSNEGQGSITVSGKNIGIEADNGIANLSEKGAKAEVSMNASDTLLINAKNGVGIDTSGQGATTTVNARVLQVNAHDNQLAYAKDNASIQLNFDAEKNAPLANSTSRLTGDIEATGNASINVGLGSATSWMEGGTSDGQFDQADDSGTIRIHGSNGSMWQVKQFKDEEGNQKDSNLTEYFSHNRSTVDLTTEELGQNLNIVNLRGNSADFKLRTYVDDNRVGTDRDHVHIKEGSGAHTIMVASTGNEWSVPNQADYLVWHEEENGATSQRLDTANARNGNALSFALSNAGERVDAGTYSYKLMTRDAQDGQGTEWFLQRTNKPSNTTETVTSVPAIAIPGAAWFAELSDLRKRLGEVRYGAQDGLWARVITWEDDVSGLLHNGFHQKAYGLNLGLDRIVRQDEKSMWLLGGNLKAYRAEQDFKVTSHGDGETDSYGLFLYATYADWDGYYADMVLSADRFYQKLHATMSNYQPTSGHFHSYGLGASIEVGKMCSFMDNAEGWGAWYNNWFIEPQAQLSYYWVDGKDFSMDNGLKVSQGDGETLTGRLGFVLGKKFNYGKKFEAVDKRYTQFYVTGGIEHEFAGEQDVKVNDVRFSENMFGTRYYYGAGFDWNMKDDTRLYAQIEREEGHRYDRDYYVTIGLKTNF